MKTCHFLFSILLVVVLCSTTAAQVNFNGAATYGLRKLVPYYGGKALQVRRTCDNGTGDIGFTTCGDLDTNALKTFVLAANPLSAMTATSATAYSLRRLRCSYVGPAIRVRSTAAGSPTLDIGFTTNGDLDTATLKTFIGSNSGFVTTWFDQSGNLRNASQATAANQPRIVNAGVVDRQGAMPAVRFLGMGCTLATLPFTTYGTAACFNGVARVATDVTYNTIVNKTTANYPAPLDLYNSQMVIGNGPTYNFYGYGQTFNASLPLSVWTYQAAAGGSYAFYYNGGLTGSGTIGAYGDAGTPLVLGGRADGMTGLNGWIAEVFTFDALPTSTDRQYLEWTQSQYYGTNGPALVLPVAPASASITIWYDQSGNGRHAIQPITFNQPSLLSAGNISKNNGYPTIAFNGFPQNLIAPLSATAYPVTISLLANTSGLTGAGAFVKLGTDLNVAQGGIAIGIGSSGGTYLISGTSVIGLKEFAAWCPANPNVNYPANPFTSTTIQQASGLMSTYLNGSNVALSNASTAVGASISGNLFIGGYANASTNLYAATKTSELTVFASALKNTQRTLLENNQAAYSNITISNSKYTVPAAGSYNRYVSGVGRESATDSVSETRSSVGMGFVVGQAATDFLKDNGDYMTYGVNCPVSAALSTLNLPASVTQRWNNDWYVNKTDVGSNNGNLRFYFDFSDYGFSTTPGPSTAANYELLARGTAAGNYSIVTGTTKSITGDRIFFTVDAGSIPTGYYTIGTKNIGASPLPVELTAFDGSCMDDVVYLNWSTATQTNNDHFSVERSVDGLHYEIIGTVKGAGTSYQTLHYAFNDEQPLGGVTYYRLSQTDRDGTAKIFPPVVVTCGNAPTVISVAPNPNDGSFTVKGMAPHSEVKVFTSTGTVVFQQQNVPASLNINLGNLPAGLYFLHVDGASQQTVKKLVIQH